MKAKTVKVKKLPRKVIYKDKEYSYTQCYLNIMLYLQKYICEKIEELGYTRFKVIQVPLPRKPTEGVRKYLPIWIVLPENYDEAMIVRTIKTLRKLLRLKRRSS